MIFSSYAIESTNNNASGCYWSFPTSWTIKGSNDNVHWDVITTRKSNNDLNLRGHLIHYQLNREYNFNYIRFTSKVQDDPQRYFSISRIELYTHNNISFKADCPFTSVKGDVIFIRMIHAFLLFFPSMA